MKSCDGWNNISGGILESLSQVSSSLWQTHHLNPAYLGEETGWYSSIKCVANKSPNVYMPFSILACWKMAFVFHESTLNMHFFCKRSSFDHFVWTVCCNRKKPLLFYFNIMKCASPMVLLEFQCPTTQVWPHSFFHVVFSSNLLVSFFVFSQFKCFPAASSSATSCLHSAVGEKYPSIAHSKSDAYDSILTSLSVLCFETFPSLNAL